ncbi:hypothetical protein [Archaeoglobus veneficus]|uniref:Uncharacterized protein n=1 Tax=Archaeoglobus veneficus (strain DSM 11195 / SNP6) TaxID=693661 RepID=F2KP83_ARCVS|nr:hypothetical protein [Archaeoglobus veneficus]AEA47487.1 hypothetical protein Arcve_1484 [Archaeoglobus veneficus SNP6]
MRAGDMIITVLSVVLFALCVYLNPSIEPLILVAVFAILSTLPYHVKNSRIRFFGYFFFGACVYWTVGRLLTHPEMLGDFTFILTLSMANATGAIISTIERSEHAYSYSIAAVAAYPSSFLMAYTYSYPDVSTLLVLILVTLSAMWIYFFQGLKGPQMGVREGIVQSIETALLTVPIFLLLIVIPWLIYHVMEINPTSVGLYIFRYVLLSFITASAACILRDFVTYLGGYKRDYRNGRAVFIKGRSS